MKGPLSSWVSDTPDTGQFWIDLADLVSPAPLPGALIHEMQFICLLHIKSLMLLIDLFIWHFPSLMWVAPFSKAVYSHYFAAFSSSSGEKHSKASLTASLWGDCLIHSDMQANTGQQTAVLPTRENPKTIWNVHYLHSIRKNSYPHGLFAMIARANILFSVWWNVSLSQPLRNCGHRYSTAHVFFFIITASNQSQHPSPFFARCTFPKLSFKFP